MISANHLLGRNSPLRDASEEGFTVRKIAGMVLLVIGVSGVAMAVPAGVPEVDAGSGVSALALISGAMLVIRGRRK
jgi:hypothetical protein